ncbi:MAG: response regulator [Synergistaceae bacterium]|jgi:signal transduction histidine kinase/ActR/RegA family two-component response regulator|nr:response regulator [Synergistaceae bacterium]
MRFSTKIFLSIAVSFLFVSFTSLGIGSYLMHEGIAEILWLETKAGDAPETFERFLHVLHAGELASIAALSLFAMIIAGFASRSIAHFMSETAREDRILSPSAKAEIKHDLLLNVGREIKTQINTIIGLSELTLCSGRIVSEENYENLEKICNSGIMLSEFVRDLMDIAKMESSKIGLDMSVYDTQKMIEDEMAINVVRAANKPIEFILAVDDSMPRKLYGDEFKIKRVLDNLLSYAFRCTEKGSVRWSVFCEKTGCDDDDIWLVSKITDTGAGIVEDESGTISADPRETKNRQYAGPDGNGLGFSVTRRILDMMGGDISVESKYGAGRSFTVRIKQRVAGDGAAIGANAAKSLCALKNKINKLASGNRITRAFIPYANVLLVDDKTDDLDLSRRMLKPYGMRIDCVDSGQAAVELVMAEDVKYDAIFIDDSMAGMDGIETLRLIRMIHNSYADFVPIIALSANHIPNSAKFFLKKGFQAFLQKPLNLVSLNDVVNRWVRDEERGNVTLPETVPFNNLAGDAANN